MKKEKPTLAILLGKSLEHHPIWYYEISKDSIGFYWRERGWSQLRTEPQIIKRFAQDVLKVVNGEKEYINRLLTRKPRIRSKR